MAILTVKADAAGSSGGKTGRAKNQDGFDISRSPLLLTTCFHCSTESGTDTLLFPPKDFGVLTCFLVLVRKCFHKKAAASCFCHSQTLPVAPSISTKRRRVGLDHIAAEFFKMNLLENILLYLMPCKKNKNKILPLFYLAIVTIRCFRSIGMDPPQYCSNAGSRGEFSASPLQISKNANLRAAWKSHQNSRYTTRHQAASWTGEQTRVSFKLCSKVKGSKGQVNK